MNVIAHVPSEKVLRPRGIEQLVSGQATSDGAGVKLTRIIDRTLQKRLDPFLMLDAFRSENPEDYIAGFPAHPHRGFETVTYLVAGRLRHRDDAGHEGLLLSGGMQWMTAGRGVIHSEMPEQENGAMEGFQLWLNLPAADKLREPGYWDIQSSDIPEFLTSEGVMVRLLAGTSHGVTGAVNRPVTEPLIADLHLPAAARYTQLLSPDANALIYVYRGEVNVDGRKLTEQRMAVLSNPEASDGIRLQAVRDSRALLIAGRPLKEPIAQYGPFVMNTHEEIQQAIADYNTGRLSRP